MRRFIFFLIIVSFSGTVWAADPIIGTWELNINKSIIPVSEHDIKLKSETIICREMEGGWIETTINTINTDGSNNLKEWIFPKEGGILRTISGQIPKKMISVATLVNPGHYYLTITANGRQVNLYHFIVSKDGKSMKGTLTGLDKEGNPQNITWFFEKK